MNNLKEGDLFHYNHQIYRVQRVAEEGLYVSLFMYENALRTVKAKRETLLKFERLAYWHPRALNQQDLEKLLKRSNKELEITLATVEALEQELDRLKAEDVAVRAVVMEA